MSKFLLAFKKIFNLISFNAPSEETINNLSETEAIIYVNESENTSSIMAVFNSGESIELLSGNVVSTNE